MGLLDDFTGKTTANAAKASSGTYTLGNEKAQGTLGAGLTSANQSTQGAIDSYRNAGQQAEDVLNVNYGNAIDAQWKAGGQALDTYNNARTASLDYLNTGYGNGITALQGALDKASGYFEPYIQNGTQYNGMLATALGANGQGAQQDFYTNYANNDPFRAENEQLANQSIMRAMNAQGLGGSGREGLAVSRASLERGAQDMNTYLDRVQRGAEMGGQYAGQLSNIQMQGGQGIAQLEAGRGNALSAAEQGYAGNIANTYTGTAGRVGDLAADFGRQRAGVAEWTGGQVGAAQRGMAGDALTVAGGQSNLQSTLAKAQADAQMAEAAAKQQGINNMLKVAGLAVNAYTGGTGNSINKMLNQGNSSDIVSINGQ